jgi:hypothetical protein
MAEGEASLDEFDGMLDGFGGGAEDVDVVGHDDEAIKEKFTLIAIAKECRDHEFGVGGALEDAYALVGYGSEGVRARVQTGHFDRVSG